MRYSARISCRVRRHRPCSSVAAKHEGAADFDSDWTGTGSHRDLLTIEASKDEAIEQFRIGAPLILENADGNLLAQSK